MQRKEKIYFHNFLTGMRTGQNVTLEQLGWGLYSADMLSRIEAGERLPDKMTRDRLMERLGFEDDGFEDYLQPDEYDLWELRDRPVRAVDAGDVPEAERLLQLLEQEDTEENVVLRQLCLTMRAQLMQYRGASEEELREIFGEALSCTVPDIALGKWCGSLLAVQEWNLLAEYIRCGGDAGPVAGGEASDPYAVRAMEKLLEAVRASSKDVYSRAKICPKAAYYLCLEQLKAQPEPSAAVCRRLLQICAEAVEDLRSCMRMYWLCELLELMERILVMLAGLSLAESGERATASFELAWDRLRQKTAQQQSMAEAAAYSVEDMAAMGMPDDAESLALLTGQIRQWREVLTGLYREYGVSEHMENCCYLYSQTQNYRIGDVVRKRRRMLGMSVQELCQGICSEKTFRRLENNKMKTQRAIWRELFCRLGLSPECKRESVVTERHEVINMYRSAKDALNNRETEKVHRLLQQMKEALDEEIPANRQELKHMECLCRLHKQVISAEECAAGIKEALQYSVPLESIKRAKDGTDIYLTCAELECLYNIAMKSKDEAEELNIELLESIARQCMPEDSIHTYINVYELIMNGVASRLGDAGDYEKSTEISERVMRECLSARRMGMLASSLYNRLWNKMEEVKKGTSAEPGISAAQELQKCIQLARLCKRTFFEKFYYDKLHTDWS